MLRTKLLFFVLLLFLPTTFASIVFESNGTFSSTWNSGSFVIQFADRDFVDPIVQSNSVTTTTDTTATILVVSNESVNLSVYYGTSSTVLSNFNSVTSFASSTSITLTGLSESTTYYYNITICDISGNCASDGPNSFTTNATTVSSPSPSGSSGGGGGGGTSSGGGGGGGGGGGLAVRGTQWSKFWDVLPAGTTSFLVNNNDIAITRVEMTTSADASPVDFTIYKPGLIPEDIPEIKVLYQLLEIDAENVPDSIVSGASLTFAVSEAWVDANAIDSSTIAMYRLVNGVWVELNTRSEASSNGQLFFTASTPGFSYFAIVGKAIPTALPAPSEPGSPTSPPPQSGAPIPTGEVVNPPEVTTGPPITAGFFAQYGLLLWLLLVPIILGGIYLGISKPKEDPSLYYFTDLERHKHMKTQNNWTIRNLYDLQNALVQMSEEVFSSHVTPMKNDFSKWVRLVYNDKAFASAIKKTKSKESMLNLVQAKISYLEKFSHKQAMIKKSAMEKDTIENLFSYIDRSKKGGASNTQIYSSLSNAGWKEADIVQALYGGTKPIMKNITDLPNPEVQNRQRINNYIYSAMQKRMTRDKILENLLKAGWSFEMVQEELQKYFK